MASKDEDKPAALVIGIGKAKPEESGDKSAPSGESSAERRDAMRRFIEALKSDDVEAADEAMSAYNALCSEEGY